MTMGQDKRIERRAGVFVALGLALFTAIVLMLGGNEFLFRPKFKLFVKFHQSQGLDQGSEVSFSGLKVGYVSALAYEPEQQSVRLELTIDEKFQKVFTTASIAKVKTKGALGDKYVFVAPATEPGEVLPEGGELKAENQGDFLDILAEKSSKLENIGDLVTELTTLVSSLNQEKRTVNVVENLGAFSKNLRALTSDPALISAIRRLDTILKKIDNGDGTLGRLINDPTVHEKILDLMGESKRNRYLKPLLQESAKVKP
jgi:phospholipid/cholesterol/gamma-HCH transport system substrate-binding protein